MLENITNFDFKELNKFDKIFVLVSGGIDSTYLLEIIYQYCNFEKVFPVNCYNPYEQNPTLEQISKFNNYILVKPVKSEKYAEILEKSFKLIPKVLELKKEGKYDKHLFGCCRIIKHKTFLKLDIFREKNTVVISGIKYGDGKQRALWLKSLKEGITYSANTKPLKGFYHLHKKGQYFCYPFRDYLKSELPIEIVNELKKKYQFLTHSGCFLCPVLIIFANKSMNNKDENTRKRYEKSLEYYNKIFGVK